MSQIKIVGIRPDDLRDLKIAIGLQGYPSLNAFFKAQIRATITVAKQQLPDCFDRLHPNLIAQQILHVLTGVTVSATLKELRLAIGDPVTEYQLRQALALLEEEKLIDRSKDYVLDPSSGRPTYRWRKKTL